MKKVLLSILSLGFAFQAGAQTITTISPAKGAAGEELVIQGSSLPEAANTVVSFGSIVAPASAGSSSELKAQIPPGARFGLPSIANTASGYQAYGSQQFLPTFAGEAFDPAKLAAPKYFSDLTGLFDLEVADFDQDGKPDMISTHAATQVVRVYRNTSTSYTNPTFAVSNFTTSYMAADCKVGDVDGDGKPDLLLSGYSSNINSLYLLPNTSSAGNIQFGSAKQLNLTVPGAAKLMLHDLNGDGKPELIASNKGNGILSIFENNSSLGSISFQPTPLTIAVSGANHSYGLDMADLNQDGKVDICLSANQENKIYILENTSTGSSIEFANQQIITTDYGLIDLKLADLNGDGLPDLAVSNIAQSAVYLWPNASTGSTITFGTLVKAPTDMNPWGLDVADMNGDGKIELIVGHLQAQSVAVLENTGTANSLSFNKHSLALSTKTRNLRAVDITADGKADIVFAGTSSSQIGIIRNSHCITPSISPEGPLTLCQGTSKILTATLIPGASYAWYKDGIQLSETSRKLTVTAAGSYSVQTTSPEGCTFSSNTVTVEEAETAIGNITFDPIGAVCETDDFTLKIPGVDGASYTFSGPNGFSQSSETPSVTLQDAKAAMAGVYQVFIKTADCEFTVNSEEVVILPNPKPSVSSSSGTKFCNGSNVYLSTAEGYSTYRWYKNGTALSSAQSHQLLITEGGEYRVEVLNTKGCSRSSDVFSIKQVQPPVASFTTQTLVCLEKEITFTNTSSLEAGETPSFRWKFGDGQESTEANPSHTFTEAGIYSVSLEVGYQGLPCREVAVEEIEIIVPPTIRLEASAPAFCSGDSVFVKPDQQVSAALWDDGNTNIERWIKNGGTHTVTYNTASGCSVTSSIELTEHALPAISLTANKMLIAPGETVTLTASGAFSYTWEDAPTLSSLNGAEVTVMPARTTTYRLSGENEEGCVSQAEITIEVDESFQVETPKIFIPAREGNWEVKGSEYYPDVQLRILNQLGQVVFEEKGYNNSWNGTQGGQALPADVYYYFFLSAEGKILKSGSITLIR